MDFAKIRYLLDSESTSTAMKSRHFTLAQIIRQKRGKLAKNWELLLLLTKVAIENNAFTGSLLLPQMQAATLRNRLTRQNDLRTTYFPPEKLIPQSKSAGEFWKRFTLQQMQCIPQCNTYRSVTDRLVIQLLKRFKPFQYILLSNVHHIH